MNDKSVFCSLLQGSGGVADLIADQLTQCHEGDLDDDIGDDLDDPEDINVYAEYGKMKISGKRSDGHEGYWKLNKITSSVETCERIYFCTPTLHLPKFAFKFGAIVCNSALWVKMQENFCPCGVDIFYEYGSGK